MMHTARSVPVRAEMVPGLGLGRVADMVPGIGCPGPGMGGSGDPDPVFDCNSGQIRRMSKFGRMPIFTGNLHLSDSD